MRATAVPSTTVLEKKQRMPKLLFVLAVVPALAQQAFIEAALA
jgi:hypothetical protein